MYSFPYASYIKLAAYGGCNQGILTSPLSLNLPLPGGVRRGVVVSTEDLRVCPPPPPPTPVTAPASPPAPSTTTTTTTSSRRRDARVSHRAPRAPWTDAATDAAHLHVYTPKDGVVLAPRPANPRSIPYRSPHPSTLHSQHPSIIITHTHPGGLSGIIGSPGLPVGYRWW